MWGKASGLLLSDRDGKPESDGIVDHRDRDSREHTDHPCVMSQSTEGTATKNDPGLTRQ